jgi:hypothetical protein
MSNVRRQGIHVSRDNFTKATKTALAKRAGYRCSYPGCKSTTVGPSEEGSEATANTGEAAHISAASGGPGARRWISVLSPKYRSSIDNGIWCCAAHAKLIDTDEVTFTIPMLRQWRRLAEQRAQLRQAYGDIDFTYHSELVAVGLAPDLVNLLPGSDLSSKIGLAVRHAWLPEICGKDAADAVRDFLIEHARNAFFHGGATSVEVKFIANAIEVADDGAPFSVANLAGPHTRGGGMAYRALLEARHLGHASSRRTGNKNHVHIPFVLDVSDLPRVNPCAVALDHEDIRAGIFDVAQLVGCDRVFFVAPDYAVFSDGPMYEGVLRQALIQHPNAVLIFPHTSSRVLEHYARLFPTAKVETW